MLELYGFARVNEGARGFTRDLRVLWTLEEIGLPYAIVGMDHPNHDLDTPAYRALNPFGQIPVIVDDGVVVSESGAIVLYLARKSGMLMPRDLAGESQVLRWSIAALTTIELPLLSQWFVNLSGGKHTKPSEALQGWAVMRLQQLDGWLSDRRFVATDDFTVADILMTHVLDPASYQELLAPFPHVVAYRARCKDRPAWKKTLAAYDARVEAA
jgi:glutathione S-transferase